MLIVLLVVGLLLMFIGYILNEKNASYLLSPYNSMNEEERKSFKLQEFLRFFRLFHLILGASLIIFGVLFYFLFNEIFMFFLLVGYPILAYIYFMFKTRKYLQGINKKIYDFAIVILFLTLLLIGFLFGLGNKKSSLEITPDFIKISGMYGETIRIEDIDHIEKNYETPKIKRKMNGYSLGDIHKGHYRLVNGEEVKLLIEAKEKPCIYIEKKNGEKIYYIPKEEMSNSLIEDLMLRIHK